VIDTAGLSLVRGGKQRVRDLASAPRIPGQEVSQAADKRSHEVDAAQG
jgi:hypothetical protein